MKIHEYQAKEIFKQYDIPVQQNVLITNPEEARGACTTLGPEVVLKSQVLVGGRGKAGGVRVVKSEDEAVQTAKEIFALNIKGYPVQKILVEPAASIEREYYVGLTVDRTTKTVMLMMSKEGGVDIEDLAVNDPEKIVRFPILPAKGIDKQKLEVHLYELFEAAPLVQSASRVIEQLYTLFWEEDLTLVEINPFALLKGQTLLALDAKIVFDDNALFKHPQTEELKNEEEYSPQEIDAKSCGLTYVSMDGEIGCIVNGAGLAMATMDIIKLYNGQPANFLDVGGSSNPKKVLNALRIILQNPKVKAILINIFGGITRCDDIANGILMALEQIEIRVPLVIRLIGTNEQQGRELLQQAGIMVKEDLSSAVEEVVSLA